MLDAKTVIKECSDTLRHLHIRTAHDICRELKLNNPEIKTIHLSRGTALEVINLVSDALKFNTTVKHFCISHIQDRFYKETMYKIANLLKANKTLEQLELQVSFQDNDALNLLFDALPYSSLKELNLKNAKGIDFKISIQHLARLLPYLSIEKMILPTPYNSDEAGKSLCDGFIAGNTSSIIVFDEQPSQMASTNSKWLQWNTYKNIQFFNARNKNITKKNLSTGEMLLEEAAVISKFTLEQDEEKNKDPIMQIQITEKKIQEMLEKKPKEADIPTQLIELILATSKALQLFGESASAFKLLGLALDSENARVSEAFLNLIYNSESSEQDQVKSYILAQWDAISKSLLSLKEKDRQIWCNNLFHLFADKWIKNDNYYITLSEIKDYLKNEQVIDVLGHLRYLEQNPSAKLLFGGLSEKPRTFLTFCQDLMDALKQKQYLKINDHLSDELFTGILKVNNLQITATKIYLVESLNNVLESMLSKESSIGKINIFSENPSIKNQPTNENDDEDLPLNFQKLELQK